MLSRLFAASAVALTLALSAPGQAQAQAQAPDPLTYEQYVSCAALFVLFSEEEEDAEMRTAFETAATNMAVRALRLGTARGLGEEDVVEAVATVADNLDAATSELPPEQRRAAYRDHAPGMSVCIDEAFVGR